MEIEGPDDLKIPIRTDSKTEFGRGLGFPFSDQAVSRRHILFELEPDKNQSTPNSETRVHFEVLGKNPVWVFEGRNGDAKVFRRYDKGEMRVGDAFCVSSKKPILFKLKRSEVEEERGDLKELERVGGIPVDEEMAETIQSGIEASEQDEELGFESFDVSDIDPVKEFGFLVMGHELEQYPKTKICAIKDWEWFLEEPREESETDEDGERKRSKGKKVGRRKRKDEGYDDEEWTGEREDEEVISKVRKGKKPRYTTRSKDISKPVVGLRSSKKSEQKKTVDGSEDEEDDNDEEEDEETLGGFIVDEEEVEEEYTDDDEEEEEEEFEDEDVDD